MNTIKKAYYFEHILYIVLWGVALAIPFFMPGDKDDNEPVWREWGHLLPFLLIFVINNYILAPKLFFKKKYTWYIISCLVLVFAATFLSELIHHAAFRSIQHGPAGNNMHLPPPPGRGIGKFGINVGLMIIGLLMIGFNTGIKLFVQSQEDQYRKAEQEKQHLTTELAFLKHQISPHFFMNTLNNIHALIDIDTEKAKDAVIKLSRLMRYLLYETNDEKVSLKKEIEFIESYIQLMRLRYDEENVSVKLSYPDNTDQIQVPAFIFLSFIENTFKHGVAQSEKCFIEVSFVNDGQYLLLQTLNSLPARKASSINSASGIGYENVKKRLDILYKNNYSLNMHAKENIFEVQLKIPIE